MKKIGRSITTILIILLAIFFAEGFSKTKTSPPEKSIFQSVGTVVTVEPENGFITIKDTGLPFWLKTITMRLRGNDKKTLNTLEFGNKINFSVAKHGKGVVVSQIAKLQKSD